MSVEPITLNLPGHLYDRLKRRAEQSHRTVEAELMEVVAWAVPVAEDLPDDLNETMTSLALLDDETLWRAARSHLPPETADQLERLHLKQQRDGLSGAEVQELARLMRQYERSMLVRAQAAALLNQRGHDVSELAPRQ
jgi:hypothetical protein